MRYILVAILFYMACGQDEKVEYQKIPYEGEVEERTGDIAFKEIKEHCMSCHASQAPVFSSKSVVLTNQKSICKVLKAGTMPPAGPIDEAKEIMEDLKCD